jgi:Family of unknown function (DUF6212)
MSDAATQLWIEAEDLAAVFGAGPVIILDATLPDCLPLYGLGARVLRLQAVPDGLLLRPAGATANVLTVGPRRPPRLLSQVPGDVLAVITREQATARRLIAWWQAVGGERCSVPPVVVAESGLAALPVLLRHALAEVSDLTARCVELELAMAALREDGEDTRVALREVSRSLGNRPPAPLLLALSRPAGAAGGTLALPVEHMLRLDLPLPVQGIAALALHLASPHHVGPLRVRVLGAGSGRVAGAWTVPGSALVPGWLRLDLPSPAGPAAEDAVLELATEAAGLLLSAAEPGEADQPGPALLLWTSRPGGRFAAAKHFDWAAWEGDAPPPGTPLLPAPDLFATARLAGPLQLVPLGGADASRATLRLAAGWQEATMLLPDLALQPQEAVRLELRAGAGDLRGASVALSLLPPDAGATLAELQASALARTGWRLLEGTTTLALAAPEGAPPLAILALALRNALPDAGQGAEIGLVGVRLLRPAPGDAPRPPEPPAMPQPLIAPSLALAEYPLALPPDAPPMAPAAPPPRLAPIPDPPPTGRAAASFGSARLEDHMAGDGYELIDLQLRNLVAAELNWPELKFKLSVSGAAVTLEFRGGPDFPRMFEEWPGVAEDEYGPVHHIVAEPGRLFGHDRFRTPRDRALLAGLLEVLPAAVAAALAGGKWPGVDAAAWAEAAQAFVQRMRATEADTAA